MTSDQIRQARTADATVTVLDRGSPLANRQVTVAQRSHKFLFGCIGFDIVRLANGELGEPESGPGTGARSLGERWAHPMDHPLTPSSMSRATSCPRQRETGQQAAIAWGDAPGDSQAVATIAAIRPWCGLSPKTVTRGGYLPLEQAGRL
ncbi:MAG: hypothetical protein ACXWNI_02445, partial [Candidatus Limnocylindrales bacterium]